MVEWSHCVVGWLAGRAGKGLHEGSHGLLSQVVWELPWYLLPNCW